MRYVRVENPKIGTSKGVSFTESSRQLPQGTQKSSELGVVYIPSAYASIPLQGMIYGKSGTIEGATKGRIMLPDFTVHNVYILKGSVYFNGKSILENPEFEGVVIQKEDGYFQIEDGNLVAVSGYDFSDRKEPPEDDLGDLPSEQESVSDSCEPPIGSFLSKALLEDDKFYDIYWLEGKPFFKGLCMTDNLQFEGAVIKGEKEYLKIKNGRLLEVKGYNFYDIRAEEVPVLEVTVTEGTAIGTTKLQIGPTIRLKVSDHELESPHVGDLAPTGSGVILNYKSQTNVSGVDAYKNKYIGIYEVDSMGKVIKFNQVCVNKTQIRHRND